MVSGADRLLRGQQWHPALRLEGLTRLINDNHVKLLLLQLKPSRPMQRRQHDLAPRHQATDAFPLPLAVLLAQLLEVGVDRPALAAVARLADRRLLGVHLGADVLDDGAGLRGAREHVERVVQHRGQQAGRVPEPDQGGLVRGEALDDVVDADVGGAADEDAEVALEELEDEFDEGVGFASLP